MYMYACMYVCMCVYIYIYENEDYTEILFDMRALEAPGPPARLGRDARPHQNGFGGFVKFYRGLGFRV